MQALVGPRGSQSFEAWPFMPAIYSSPRRKLRQSERRPQRCGFDNVVSDSANGSVPEKIMLLKGRIVFDARLDTNKP